MRKNKTINKILKLKDSKKKEIELEVKRAADKEEEEKNKLQALEKNYSDMLAYFNEKHDKGALDVNSLMSCHDFFSRINGKIKEQKNIHTQCAHELACLKNNLVNAHKEKRMFEILNDKAVRREKKEELSVEQKENDFIALSRRLR